MVDIPVNESTAETTVVITVNGQELCDFDFLATSDTQVSAEYRPLVGPAVPLTLNTDYTVSGLNLPNGGSINLVGIATVVNDKVYIYRDTPIEREKDWQNEGDYKADLVNAEQDEIYMIMQELDRDIGRAVKVPMGTPGITIIPGPENTVPKYDANGNLTGYVSAAELGNAETWSYRARAWAVTAEDVPVNDTVNPPGFSSFHWNQKTAEIYDAFDVRYLGAKPSDPALDNDGEPLIVGAIYFNSDANEMRVWTGAAWAAVNAIIDGSVTDEKVVDFGPTSPTAGKISFTQTGAGAVARPLIAKIKDGPVSLEDFAYVSGNALTALNNAIACGQPIRLGPKVYDVNGVPDIPTNRDFFLSGWGYGASALRFTGVTRGLEVVQDDYTHATHIRDMNILTTQQEPGTGLKVTYSKADSITNRSLRRCSIIDVDVRGELDQSQGWATGIHLVDVHSADIIRPLVTGRRDAAVTGRNSFNKMANGIRITGADTPTFSSIPSTILISHPKIDCAQNAIYSEGEVEGMMVETPILVGVINGIVTRYTTTRPWTKISGGHVNFFDAAVDLQNNPQSNIDDMILYKFEQTDAVSVGIILRTCDDSEINNILLMNQATSVALNGDWHGIQVDNSARCNISDIRHNRPSSTIVLTGTTTNTTARGLDPQGAYTGATQKVFDDQSSGTNTYEGGGKAVATVSNAGATTATAVGVDAVAYSFPFVSKGERFLITANAALVTGGVAGDRLATLHKVAGTATAVFGNNGANVASRSLGGTTGEVDLALTAIMTVTVSGSYQLGLLCQSTGGNSSMAANAAQMTITRL